MVILAANITYWSKKATDWVFGRKWDIALLAEVHFHPSALDTTIKALLGRFVPTYSTPRISDDSPAHTYGGALVLRRNHLQGSPPIRGRTVPPQRTSGPHTPVQYPQAPGLGDDLLQLCSTTA